MFLIIYATENLHAFIVSAEEKTFRKWSWIIVRALSELKFACLLKFCSLFITNFWNCFQTEFADRLEDKPVDNCLKSVDGTDSMINESKPFDKSRNSHKFYGPGVRYEIAISIETVEIVWAYGPWPCNVNRDLRIFRNGLKKVLNEDEFVVAHSSYSDERCVQPPGLNHPMHRLLAVIHARHENLNKRLKQFAVLKNKFRHEVSLHSYCFCCFKHYVALFGG